jgi:hypothetical protein
MHIYNWHYSITSDIPLYYTDIDYNVHGAFPLLYCLPLLIPLAPLSNPLYLQYLEPSLL